jgi:transposase
MMSALSVAAYFPFARVKLVSQNVHLDCHPSATLIRLEPDRRYRPVCSDCGQEGTVHSAGLRRHIRDLNMGQAQTLLHVEYRRVWCSACDKARVERLDFADPSQRITHRMAQYVYGLCKLMTIQDVARHLDLDPKTVKAVDKRFLQQEFGGTDYQGLRILAVDEISLRHGQNGYMTVVLDYLTGRVAWVGEGRKAETLDAFFTGMTDQQKQAIEAVAMDMLEAFVKSVQNNCPQARIVFDLFHLVKGYGQVIDEVRRQEYKKAEKNQRAFIKGSRYLLLSNRDNLRADQQSRLDELLAINQRLCSVYVLKDQLKAIYQYQSRSWAKRALEQWCAMAEEVDHPLMRRFIGRLRFFEYGILNHCEYPIGTSKLEGVNNKIKVIKRKAYGFHDSEYFALKVKQALPGNKLTTEMG